MNEAHPIKLPFVTMTQVTPPSAATAAELRVGECSRVTRYRLLTQYDAAYGTNSDLTGENMNAGDDFTEAQERA